MPIYNETIITGFSLSQSLIKTKVLTVIIDTPYYSYSICTVYTQTTTPIYGTLTDAENYFKGKITSSVTNWIDAPDNDKIASLRQATQIIDSLNFKGTKLDPSNQLLTFPTDLHGLPDNILKACYEIALKLLSGIDPDIEVENLSRTSQGYGFAKTNYDRSFVQDHIRAGVPSALAWTILRPYLCDPLNIKVSRGD